MPLHTPFPTPSGVAPTDNAANLCGGQNPPEPLELEARGSGGKDQGGFHAATANIGEGR